MAQHLQASRSPDAIPSPPPPESTGREPGVSLDREAEAGSRVAALELACLSLDGWGLSSKERNLVTQWAKCWAQNCEIREEDKSPPPSSPPPLFSVIPGGFIRQLVRETEKESKESRRKKQAALSPLPAQETTELPNSQHNSKPNSITKSGSQQGPQVTQPSSLEDSNIPSKESQGASGPGPLLMASINGEKPQESGPSETPTKRTLPLKRGVRRGDVLLMVAKLDPDLAKVEQKTHPQDTPTSKTLPQATDPGGGKEGLTPGYSRGPKASREKPALKTEKTLAGNHGGSVHRGVSLPKEQLGEGSVRSGADHAQTKGLKGGKAKGKEVQGPKPPAPEPGEGGQSGAEEKDTEAPPNKMENGGPSKNSVGAGQQAAPHSEGRKWGGSLGRKATWNDPQSKKDNEGALLRKGEKAGEPQLKKEKMETLGGEGEPLMVTEKMGEAQTKVKEVGQPQSQPGEVGDPQGKSDMACAAPEQGGTRAAATVADRREDLPANRGEKGEGPDPRADAKAKVLEVELQGLGSSPEAQVDQSQTRENQERPALQEGDTGGHGGDSDQVSELQPQVWEEQSPGTI
ncbi:unconventional myosin-XVIIIb-like [Tenrec ecaudatus]|uniref:unconventional myosin-XVIIIb-like n=1 Tax=Tenrec ecaudatus TaxID=94439 RepID=UPI003F59A7E6